MYSMFYSLVGMPDSINWCNSIIQVDDNGNQGDSNVASPTMELSTRNLKC